MKYLLHQSDNLHKVLRKGFPRVEEGKEAPTKFVAGASWWFLYGVTWYGKGACMETCAGLTSKDGQGEATHPSAYAPMIDWLINQYQS